MKILYVSIFIISIVFYLLISDNLNNTIKKDAHDDETANPALIKTFKSSSNSLDEVVTSFRDEIDIWTDKANNEDDIIKSSIYRSYAMSNLYFLQPFISHGEYKFLSIKIGYVVDSKVPRYIKPEIVLSIVTR